MYRIGEFSLLNKVTIKTLRYYDDIGLFKPKVVDSFTGYRYYDDERQEEFENIILYKDLGFSLEEILKLKCENKESVIIEKISELTREIEDDKHRIRVLKEMIGGDKMNNNDLKMPIIFVRQTLNIRLCICRQQKSRQLTLPAHSRIIKDRFCF